MNVSLTPHLEALVKQKVQSGLYNSSSEVMREALRLLEERDRLKQMRFEETRKAIQQGRDELDQGLGTPLDMAAVKAEARRRHNARQQKES